VIPGCALAPRFCQQAIVMRSRCRMRGHEIRMIVSHVVAEIVLPFNNKKDQNPKITETKHGADAPRPSRSVSIHESLHGAMDLETIHRQV